MGLNLWPVLAAAIATFALGAIWYSPLLFENPWKRANGLSDESLAAITSTPRVFVVVFLSYLVMAVFLGVAAQRVDVTTWWQGALLGVAVAAGFVAAGGLAVHAFSGKPAAAWLVDAGFQIVALGLMGTIIGRWQ